MSETGHVKHNPETGEVALRTIFPTDQGPQLAAMAWLVATKNMGHGTLPMRTLPTGKPCTSRPSRSKKWQ